MTRDEILQAMERLIDEADRAGFVRGIRFGASRLETLAAVVPESVTKHWLIEQAGRDARFLIASMRQEEGK